MFTSGKHAVTLEAEIAKRQLTDAFVVVRLEALCPFPAVELLEVMKLIGETVARKTDGKSSRKRLRWVWSQEEARNAGAWCFVRPRFRHWFGVEVMFCGKICRFRMKSGIVTAYLHFCECLPIGFVFDNFVSVTLRILSQLV